MKYRYRVSEPPRFKQKRSASVPHLKGRQTLRSARRPTEEPIRWDHLFEAAALPEGQTPPRRSRRPKPSLGRARRKERMFRVIATVRKAALSFELRLRFLFRAVALRLRRPPRPKTIHATPVLAGALCASLLVSLLSAGGVLLGLFGYYHRSYTRILIPDFVGRDASQILAEENLHLNLIIEYEANPDITSGLIISQTPRAGVSRRIYGKRGYCNVHLTVSRASETYYLEDLTGMSRRDALLTLQNHKISATVTEVYSDTAPKGSVIQTHPTAGTPIPEGSRVALSVSAGVPQHTVSVPNLFGMTETEANALLKSTGLTIGTVAYQSSPHAAGTIITQDTPAYSSLNSGSAVSYTVSIGERYWIPTVPDLYGLSLARAEEVLREHGLLVGTVHTVAGAAPRGTVITQVPAPNAPITSATVSVTLYVTE